MRLPSQAAVEAAVAAPVQPQTVVIPGVKAESDKPAEVPQAAVEAAVTNVVDLIPATEPAKPAVTMTSGEYNSFDDMLDAYDD